MGRCGSPPRCPRDVPGRPATPAAPSRSKARRRPLPGPAPRRQPRPSTHAPSTHAHGGGDAGRATPWAGGGGSRTREDAPSVPSGPEGGLYPAWPPTRLLRARKAGRRRATQSPLALGLAGRASARGGTPLSPVRGGVALTKTRPLCCIAPMGVAWGVARKKTRPRCARLSENRPMGLSARGVARTKARPPCAPASENRANQRVREGRGPQKDPPPMLAAL